MQKHLRIVMGALVSCLAFQTGVAQAAYPERPIKIIVPFAPGGVADLTARIIGSELASDLGQPVVVENRPGGATIIATQVVAKAPPDGYTLLLGSTNFSTNVTLYKKLPYDAEKDLTPVALAVTIPGALISPPSLGLKTFADLANYAQRNPGKLSYSSVGQGSFAHLAVEGLLQRTSLNIVHVPYSGYAPALTSVLSGETQLLASDVQGALPYVQAGKLQVLAVTSAKRLPALPDVPTVQEMGVKDYQAVGWLGILAPAGTPQQVIALLNDRINKILQKPHVAQRYTAQGIVVFQGDVDAFKRFLSDNKAGWEKVIKTARITLN
ncbi:Bug family tripartite tricarboxylate transporter substrate binding protein [Lacisediminimonas profundi]|uniref:Bug family tripartite tricarboxylate transporter substrate binding protein n=1 Tax=Lacisediminimonas profundi TaxID=2603856 RepID=UPI00124B2491|nr:tripartite tricarboxylate transporter substrate binding protein [Lacisediminimonas profundi]